MKQICRTEHCLKPIHAKGLCYNCYRRAWYAADIVHQRIRQKKSRKRNRAKNVARSKQWNRQHPEYGAVTSHFRVICRTKNPNYFGIPFFDAWNPDREGSIKTGEQWILNNLGPRPSSTHQLHIVDRKLGFVPNNLQWVPRERHKQEEMIAKLLRENQQLRQKFGVRN